MKTLLYQACLRTRQNGVENRDKAYYRYALAKPVSVFTFFFFGNRSYGSHWTPNEIYSGCCQRYITSEEAFNVFLKLLFGLYPSERKSRNTSSVCDGYRYALAKFQC